MSNLISKINNAFKTHIEAPTDINYKLAYESLKKQNEELMEENKSIKDTLNIVSDVVENIKKQNELLKDQVKILSTQNDRLTEENKKYKEKEIAADLKQENKIVKHNFVAKRNNTNRCMTINRQVNN